MSPRPLNPNLAPFNPPRWLRSAHAQTLAGKFLRRPGNIPVTRERWLTPDGDFLDLDLAVPTTEAGPPRPVVLLLHGLEGNSRRAYVRVAMEALYHLGMLPVGLNFRSCSGEMNWTPRFYHSGETGDPRWVLETLRHRFPGRPMGALGFSLGGNVLLRLLHETPGLLDAAAVVSVPFDLAAGARSISSGTMGAFYSRYFLGPLKAKVRAKASQLADRIDVPRVLEARTLRDFDEHATAPLHGFRDAEDYYTRCSSAPILNDIRTPTLILHALDDPFIPAGAVPLDAMRKNPDLVVTVADRGGHLGFIAQGAHPTLHQDVGRGTTAGVHFWGETSAALALSHWLIHSREGGVHATGPGPGAQTGLPEDLRPGSG